MYILISEKIDLIGRSNNAILGHEIIGNAPLPLNSLIEAVRILEIKTKGSKLSTFAKLLLPSKAKKVLEHYTVDGYIPDTEDKVKILAHIITARVAEKEVQTLLEQSFATLPTRPELFNDSFDLVRLEVLCASLERVINYTIEFADIEHFCKQTKQLNDLLSEYKKANISRSISLNGVKKILTNKLYAGLIEYEKWGVEERVGHHTGIISIDTFLKVQERLNLVSKPSLRKDYNDDFALRNFVLCPDCHKPCTAGWFTGKSKVTKFPYYLCKQAECTRSQKMMSQEQLDIDFSALLKDLKPKPKTIEMVQEFLVDAWRKRKKLEIAEKESIAKNIKEIEKTVDEFMELLRGTKTSVMIKQYEIEIEKNIHTKEELEQKIDTSIYSEINFKQIQDVVVKHLENPIKMWETKEYTRKRLLLNMYFSRGVVYNKKTGFQTPDLPLIVKVLTSKDTSKNSLVEMAGVKPASKTHYSNHYSQD